MGLVFCARGEQRAQHFSPLYSTFKIPLPINAFHQYLLDTVSAFFFFLKIIRQPRGIG